jgi:hypothetical protein
MTVRLWQINPYGPAFTLTIPWTPTITPLYDVRIGALAFKLLTPCDAQLGIETSPGDIDLSWRDPAGNYHVESFDLWSGQVHTTLAFRSTWTDVAATSALTQPDIGFLDRDPMDFIPGKYPAPLPKLVPDTSRTVDYLVNEATGDCSAEVTYNQQYTRKLYADL